MTLTRYADWRSRLDAYIETHADMPFAWGINDCVLFAARGIAALTGVDLSTEYFNTYSTKKEAKEILSKLTGLDSYAKAMTALPDAMGLERYENSAFAKRGDLVLLKLRARVPALGLISMDARFAVAPEPKGLAHISISQILSAWKIG